MHLCCLAHNTCLRCNLILTFIAYLNPAWEEERSSLKEAQIIPDNYKISALKVKSQRNNFYSVTFMNKPVSQFNY